MSSPGERKIGVRDRVALSMIVPAVVGVGVTLGARVLVAASIAPARDVALLSGLLVTIALVVVAEVQRRIGASTLDHLRDLEKRARHDELTGLPTRDEIRRRTDVALRTAYRHRGVVGVLFLDLDGFKAVNDAMGHDAGDVVLRIFARRLREVVRAGDVVGRFGGDEFVVVCTDLDGPEQIRLLASSILARFEQPLPVGDGEVRLVPSIGVAVAHHRDPATTDELLARADQAMYRAKRSGGGIEYHDHHQAAVGAGRLAMQRAILPALADGQFAVHYQPIVSDRLGRTVGVEGLIRWNHPEQGIIGPNRFLQEAEEAGFGSRLGEVVLREVAAQTSIWTHLFGAGDLRAAVNIAERQLVDHTFPAKVAEIAQWAGLDPSRLDLEIGEDLLLRRADDARRVLDRLVDLGCRIVIDDFGDSQGAFSRIRSLGIVGAVKIDQSVVSQIAEDAMSRAVVAAAVSTASALGIELIAEGVETTVEQQVLRDLGVDLMQGYLFRRPAAADTFRDEGALLMVDAFERVDGDQRSGGSSSLSSRSEKLRALMDG